MSSDAAQRILNLSGNRNGPKGVCTALSQKHSGYLDLLEQYQITGANIHVVWTRCGSNTDNLVYLLEAYRNGYGDGSTITSLLAPACRDAIAYGKKLPASKRLA